MIPSIAECFGRFSIGSVILLPLLSHHSQFLYLFVFVLSFLFTPESLASLKHLLEIIFLISKDVQASFVYSTKHRADFIPLVFALAQTPLWL